MTVRLVSSFNLGHRHSQLLVRLIALRERRSTRLHQDNSTPTPSIRNLTCIHPIRPPQIRGLVRWFRFTLPLHPSHRRVWPLVRLADSSTSACTVVRLALPLNLHLSHHRSRPLVRPITPSVASIPSGHHRFESMYNSTGPICLASPPQLLAHSTTCSLHCAILREAMQPAPTSTTPHRCRRYHNPFASIPPGITDTVDNPEIPKTPHHSYIHLPIPQHSSAPRSVPRLGL